MSSANQLGCTDVPGLSVTWSKTSVLSVYHVMLLDAQSRFWASLTCEVCPLVTASDTLLQVDRRYGFKGLHANSVMPGVIFTFLARHLDPEMVKAFETPYYQKLQKNAQQGAVWAAISRECEGKGGK